MNDTAILYYIIKEEGGEEYEVKFEELTPEEKIIHANVQKEWSINGKRYSEEEYMKISAKDERTVVVQKKILELRTTELNSNEIKQKPQI
jgi:hypothetical protein